jgi:hypothetical protein
VRKEEAERDHSVQYWGENGLTIASFTDIQPAIESLYHLNGFAALG